MTDPRSLPVRFSRLKYMAQSPAHYRHACDFDVKQTAPMRLGSLVNFCMFGKPATVIYSGARRAGKEWEEFKTANAGMLIVKQNEFDEANRIAESVMRYKPAAIYLAGEHVEKTINWQFCGRDFVSTPDVRGTGFIADLKVTKCAHPEKFARDALWRAYHAQLECYATAAKEGLGETCDDLAIIAVESAPPHPVTVLRLSERARLLGGMLWRGWFERLRVCEESGVWPGYSDVAVELDAPDLGNEIDFGDDEEIAA